MNNTKEIKGFAFYTEAIGGQSDVMIIRQGKQKLIVKTKKPLSDEQVTDLYWTILAMEHTEKRLGELIKDGSVSNGKE